MSLYSKTILSVIVPVLLVSTTVTLSFSASQPAGSGSGAPSSSNKFKSVSPDGNQDSAATKTNPVLFENYQKCYATLISDVIVSAADELESRKQTIKKYCRAIANAKNQKKFSDCFSETTKKNSTATIDSVIKECTTDKE